MKTTLLITLLSLTIATAKAQTVDSSLNRPVNPPAETSRTYQVADEIAPQPVGGMDNFMIKYLDKKLPSALSINRGSGATRVRLTFVVDKDGSLIDPQVTPQLSEKLTEKVNKVIEEAPKWKPGMQNGNAVKVQFTIALYKY